MSSLPIIETLPLLGEVNHALLTLLESLSPADWARPTVHPTRSVKDLAAHLLDTSLRRLSIQRDGHFPEALEIRSFQDLVDFIQQLNTEWMAAARRLSPRVLVGLIRDADAELVQLFEGVDLMSPAPFGVAWAGEEWSPMWFDMAREYTEKWHHQQQIRDAVGKPGLAGRRHLYPVLDTFLRGAPHAYREAAAKDGTGVRVEITGEAGGAWHLRREGDGWMLVDALDGAAAATISMDADTAWRLWTKGLDREAARARARVEGDAALAEPLLGMVCIMA